MNRSLCFRENKGITLIALVVTIIILIVLAGVSISMVTGQNGILKKATDAKENTEESQIDENDKFIKMEAMVQTADTPLNNPSSYGEKPNAQATADGAGKYFAKPEGATYITGTVDTGVVVNIKGSEFVWVPVDDVVLDPSRSAELPTSNSLGNSREKTYTPMAVKVGSNYNGILYNFSEKKGYLKYNNSENNYLGESMDYREPDIVNVYDGGDSDTVNGKVTLEKLTSEYNAMIVSILKYKGFYVSRYEAGLDENNNIIFKNASIEGSNITTADASNSETSSWYGLYKKIKTFTTDSDKIVSSMIWGSQYDAMMNWMAKTENIVGISDDARRNTETITGKNTNDIINNVYDLYGCHREWTLDAYNNDGRASRGGDYASNTPPAYCYFSSPNGTSSSVSSRATLYIK